MTTIPLAYLQVVGFMFIIVYFLTLYLIFGLAYARLWDLISLTGMELVLPALGGQSLTLDRQKSPYDNIFNINIFINKTDITYIYFSFEKTLMLGKIEGRRRRG